MPEHFYTPVVPVDRVPESKDARLEGFFRHTGADIRYGGGRAFYLIDADFVQMPAFADFHRAESYYATLAHELTHWTRHPSRLDRDMGKKAWGDAGLPWRNWSRNWAPRSCARTWALRQKSGKIMPPTSPHG